MATIMQKSFSAGEVTPSLYARTDIAKYQTALKTCRNFYVMRHGGVTNRPGSQFISEIRAPTTANNIRLIPFVFNNSQTYVLEFGDTYARVFKNGERIQLTGINITGITIGNPLKVVYSGADVFAVSGHVYISGVVGTVSQYINNRTFVITAINTGTNELTLAYVGGANVNATGWGAYTSGGTLERVYEFTSPYAEADLPELKYVQSADTVVLTHPSYAPRKLERTADTSWTISTLDFEANVDYPHTIAVTNGGAAGATTYNYTVTSFDPLTGQETPLQSVPPSGTYLGTTTTGNATLSTSNYNDITWNISANYGYSVANLEFNIYRELNGVYGYIGTSSGVATFRDIGYSIDATDTPSRIVEDFTAVDDYPSTATFYQQRLIVANTNNDTEKVLASKTGSFYDFAASSPIQDDDSITFKMAGRQVNEVHHLVDLGTLLLFTESGEYVANGDGAGVLTPSAINTRQSSYNGANSRLAPIVIGNSAVYVQARGNTIRDINFKFESNDYTGDELSLYSAHMFDNYSLLDWSYQKIPHSILWVVRDDGTLLGMTYIKEQAMLAWHTHDFSGGTVEAVCCVPEGNEDALYLVVNRTIDGSTQRYVEKLVTRKINDTRDIAILDSHLIYDGRNEAATTMTLSGSGWTYTDTLTLTASASYFSSSMVGSEVQIFETDGSVIRFTIGEYSSVTVVTGTPNRTVPVTLQAVATTDWALAVDEVSGLWHLEGETVAVYADGLVVASPNNSSYTEVTVADGKITLSENYAVIYVGLPITSDIETLNIDQPTSSTIADRNKLISKVSLFVEDSRGIWAGTETPSTNTSVSNLTELKIREDEDYDSSVAFTTDVVDIITEATWNNNGRVFIRQIDPVPLTILSIAPTGYVPFTGG